MVKDSIVNYILASTLFNNSTHFNITNMIDMKTSLSRKLKYIDITIKIRAFFIVSLFDRVFYSHVESTAWSHHFAKTGSLGP
jgi:hypothetical protein